MTKPKKQSAKRPASSGAPKKNGASKKAGRSRQPEEAPEEHPALRGEQVTIGLDETERDEELEGWARELDRAQDNWAAWGRSATVLKEKIDVRLQSAGLKHYYNGGVEIRASAKDPKTNITVTIHTPQAVPANAKAGA